MYRCNAPKTAIWFFWVSSPICAYAFFKFCISYAVNNANTNTPIRHTIVPNVPPTRAGQINEANPTKIKPIIPIVKNTPRKDKFLTVLYPNNAMHANIAAANTNANNIVYGLFVIATNSSGVITTPINTAYNANNNAAVAGFMWNARTCAQIDNANPPNNNI